MVYGFSPTGFSDGLLELQERWNWTEILVNRPAERELRVELREAKEKRGLRVRAVRDSAWLTTTEDFRGSVWQRCYLAGPRRAAAVLDGPVLSGDEQE